MDAFGNNLGMSYGAWSPQIPRRGITKVHGEQGAQTLQMQPDDQCIALDETTPEGKTIIWVITTDSRGIKTLCKPYEVSDYIPKPPVDVDDLNNRMKRMEEFLYAKFGDASPDGAGKADPGSSAKTQA
jgi:hypothetical protein